MKTIKNKLFILLALLLLVACKKTTINDLQYQMESTALYIYQNGQLFTGDAWSEDETTMKVTVQNGALKQIECYSLSGWLFACCNRNE